MNLGGIWRTRTTKISLFSSKMWSSHCVKLTSASRNILFNKFLTYEIVLKPVSSCKCLQNKTFRSVSSTTVLLNSKTRKYDFKSSNSFKSHSSRKDYLGQPASSLSNEDVLEKQMASLNGDLHQKNRVYKNDLLRAIAKIKDLNFSTKKQGLFLTRCCTELLPDETPANRMALVEEVWATLKPHTKFTVDHYNELLCVFIANGRNLTARSFIEQMSPCKPNATTYELLMKALGEAGDVNQATEVISNMKAEGIPATEDIFNSLIVCQGKSGNQNMIQEVRTMMKSLKLEESADTHTAVARALAFCKDRETMLQELAKVASSGVVFKEGHIMQIVKTLAAVGDYLSIPKVLRYLPSETLNTPSISPLMQSVCTCLVFQNYPVAALEIYKCLPLPSFGPKDDAGLHGRSLVRDCVKAAMPTSVINLVTKELMSSGRNPIALQSACEAALQLGKVPLALDIFTNMKQLGMPVRPHYFWPILLHSSKCYGEKGIMNTLRTMVAMEVAPDYDTIIDYVMPHVSFTSPQNLMKKLLDTGLPASLVLTPVMETLLTLGQVRAASEIGEIFQGKIEAERLLKPLLKGYLTTSDVTSAVYILEDMTQKASVKDKDWVGRFLCEFMQHRKINEDVLDFATLIQELQKKNLTISTTAADFCITRVPEKCEPATAEAIRQTLVDITDDRLVDDTEIFAHQMMHPKSMNEEHLRAHLAELEAKGMNTRGVLRKLLQSHCRDNNLQAAKEIAAKCEKEGVFLSAGMRASIFDLHVKLGELDSAEQTLAELAKTAPNFTLDEFKVLDFATLIVYRRKIARAIDMLNEQSKKRKITGGRGIELNCWRLLDATAANGSPAEVMNMFNTLTGCGYCKPTNSLLGPLIRVHLKTDDIEAAVKEFTRLANKYNKTPLKHVIMCRILTLMSDGHTEENFLNNEKVNGKLNQLAQTVLGIDRTVHGPGDVQLTLIAALAEVGYTKSLRKLLLDPEVKFHPDALLRRCERFAEEKKIAPLEAIVECVTGLRGVEVAGIYDLMLSVCQRNDNCLKALALWDKMQESDVTPSQKFIQNLCSLLKANNKEIPADIFALLDSKQKQELFN